MNDSNLFPAFFDAPYEFCGMTVRVVSAGVLSILQKVNSPFLRKHETEDDALRALMHYLYVCSAPIKDVVKAAHEPQTFEDCALEHSFNLPAGQISALAEILSQKLAGINETSVSVESEGGPSKKK